MLVELAVKHRGDTYEHGGEADTFHDRFHVYDHSFPLRCKAPRSEEPQVLKRSILLAKNHRCTQIVMHAQPVFFQEEF